MESKFDVHESGNNWQIDCPFCGGVQKLGFKKTTGQFNCFKCDERGSLKRFQKLVDDKHVVDLKIEDEETKNKPVKIKQTLAAKLHQNLKKKRAVQKYLESERGFKQQTIEHFQLGAKVFKSYTYVSIPFWKSGKLVNIKYRAIDFKDKKYKWRRIAGGESSIFHDDVCDQKNFDEVYLCEAELDCIALWNAGVKNVVACTVGAKGFKSEWFARLERFKKIYLVFDTDVDGQEGARKASSRLGMDRCYNVELPDDVKDVNEYFWDSKKHKRRHTKKDFMQLVGEARRFEPKDVMSLEYALKDLYREKFFNDELENDGFKTQWSGVNKILSGAAKPGELVVVSGPPKVGKCHKKGTKILMFDGSIKNVEDIREGDFLMGPDSRKRRVISTCTGKEQMYTIIPKYGESWGCNGSHILSLKCTKSDAKCWERGKIYNIALNDFLKLPKTVRAKLKLWRTGVEFKEQCVEYDPYFVGLWLGDGSVGYPNITKPIGFFEGYFKKFSKDNSIIYKAIEHRDRCCTHTFTTEIGKPNPLLRFLKTLTSSGEKRIPKNYLINSYKNRIKLFMGLCDSDGYADRNGAIEWSTKDYGLLLDFLYLLRSLGYRDNVIKKYVGEKTYYRVHITGDFSKLRFKRLKIQSKSRFPRDTTTSKFDIKKNGVGKYYGFELSGDHLYLLGDFTVTHNTSWVLNWMVHLAKNGCPSFIYECEMNQKRLASKMVAMQCKDFNGVDEMTGVQIAETNYAMPKREIYFGFPQHDELTLDNVVEKIKEVVKRFGVRFVCFDNLHFLVRGQNVKDEIGNVTRRFKLLAETLGIVFCLIVHPRKTGFRRMVMDDLKDSSSTAQDMDTGIFMHRSPRKEIDDFGIDVNPDGEIFSEGELENLTEIKVKSRWSEGGATFLYFVGERALFVDSGSQYKKEIEKWNQKRKQKSKKRR